MLISKSAALQIAAIAAAAMAATTAARAKGTVVNVSLWDMGEAAMEMIGIAPPMGMAMMGADIMDPTMGITPPSITEIPAGEVSFAVTNDSELLYLAMVLAPVTDPSTPLPYNTDENKVDEDAANHTGEVAELAPDETGALTPR